MGPRGRRGPGVCPLAHWSRVLGDQGVKARNLIHARIEENIRSKICGLRAADAGGTHKDVLQLLIEHSWQSGERLDMQVSAAFGRGVEHFGSLGFFGVGPRLKR